MSLADIIIQRVEIPVANTSISVRGLCVDDVLRAVFEAQDDFRTAVSLYEKTVADPTDDAAVREFLSALLRDAPPVVARVIAYAADEPAQWEKVLRLPAPVVLEAFHAVFELTFSEPDALKKFLGNLTQVMQKISMTA